MQTTDAVQRRLNALYQQKDKVTMADLLTVVQSPADLRSKSFHWAIYKVAATLDDTTQEYRDFNRDLQNIHRYGSVRTRAFCICTCILIVQLFVSVTVSTTVIHSHVDLLNVQELCTQSGHQKGLSGTVPS